MPVAVWDTYAKKKNGNVLHFDIIVPEGFQNQNAIYRFGQSFLASKGESESVLNAERCRFCHIEAPTEEMKQAIDSNGHYILEMDEIPAKLPENPSRRDIILHLRAHYSEYRFADLKGKSLEQIRQVLQLQPDGKR